MKKTYQPKAKEVTRQWHLIDAKGKVLGRLSTEVARLLIGKHKPNYSAHMDMGDYVVIVNAKDIKVTGRKEKQKVYYKHSGYPGGFKEIKYAKWLEESPEKIIEHSVKGMLPKNRLSSQRMRRMKVYANADHPYGDKLNDKHDRKK